MKNPVLWLSAKASSVHLLQKIPSVLSFAPLTTRPHDYFCFAKSREHKTHWATKKKVLSEWTGLFSWRVQWGLNPRHPA